MKNSELYKRYRPKSLDEVVGNEATVATLKNMLKRGTLPHTIMLHGPSGCGKTTIGRILRRALKCGLSDYKELNCSDFRGIDTIRELSKNMTLSPMGGSCRVFLLDEVHQLSKDGQNAALKILEDTPDHVYFILCTTDPQKLLKTILTRCCMLPVEALEESDMKKLLERVAKNAKVKLGDDDLDNLVDAAEGGARTGLVLLDKISHLDPKHREEAIKKGLEENKEGIALCRALFSRQPSWAEIGKILQKLPTEESESIRWMVMGYARSILIRGKSKNDHAFNVLVAFEQNFYDSKAAGLARACYEAIHGS